MKFLLSNNVSKGWRILVTKIVFDLFHRHTIIKLSDISFQAVLYLTYLIAITNYVLMDDPLYYCIVIFVHTSLYEKSLLKLVNYFDRTVICFICFTLYHVFTTTRHCLLFSPLQASLQGFFLKSKLNVTLYSFINSFIKNYLHSYCLIYEVYHSMVIFPRFLEILVVFYLYISLITVIICVVQVNG